MTEFGRHFDKQKPIATLSLLYRLKSYYNLKKKLESRVINLKEIDGRFTIKFEYLKIICNLIS